MKFTITIERHFPCDNDKPCWQTSVAEFPDLFGYGETRFESAMAAVAPAIELTLDATSKPGAEPQ